MQGSHIDAARVHSQPNHIARSMLAAGQPTLEDFAHDVGSAHGVDVQELAEGTTIRVETRNSLYRIVVVDGARRRVRITGGRSFPEETEVSLAGATFGGSAVKIGWIGEGMRLELSTDRGPVVTSRVESVDVDSGEMASQVPAVAISGNDW